VGSGNRPGNDPPGADADALSREQALKLCASVRTRVLVIQRSADAIIGPDRGPAVAAGIPGSQLVMLAGSGHAPHLRDPRRSEPRDP
jgi:pimeloyl-ACP methyl ester carboxylesterase